MIRVLSAALGAVAVLALSACIGGAGFSDLEQPATEDDRLPSTLPGYADDGLDAESVRYVGDHDGTSFYLAHGVPSGVCIVIYRSDTEWVVGCGSHGDVTVQGFGVRAAVIPDGAPVPENGIRIGNNIVLED